MKKSALLAISGILDIAILVGAYVIANVIWPTDNWHRFVYYICGASFGGYIVFRYGQIKELWHNN